MNEPERRIFEMRSFELHALDMCATDERILAKTVKGTDAMGHEEALLAAADVYGDAIQVLPFLREGQPGYVYAQIHKRLISALKRPSTTSAQSNVTTGEASAAQPPQPL